MGIPSQVGLKPNSGSVSGNQNSGCHMTVLSKLLLVSVTFHCPTQLKPRRKELQARSREEARVGHSLGSSSSSIL